MDESTSNNIMNIGFLPVASYRMGTVLPAYRLYKQSGAKGNVALVLGMEGCKIVCWDDLREKFEIVSGLKKAVAKYQGKMKADYLKRLDYGLRNSLIKSFCLNGIVYDALSVLDMNSGEKIRIQPPDSLTDNGYRDEGRAVFTCDVITYLCGAREDERVLSGDVITYKDERLIRNFSGESSNQIVGERFAEFRDATAAFLYRGIFDRLYRYISEGNISFTGPYSPTSHANSLHVHHR